MPLAIGAVVEGVPTTFQTPLSGHFCPVEAVVPIGALDILIPLLGVSLDIENYCTLRLLFNQSLVLDKVPEYGKPAKCCSP